MNPKLCLRKAKKMREEKKRRNEASEERINNIIDRIDNFDIIVSPPKLTEGTTQEVNHPPSMFPNRKIRTFKLKDMNENSDDEDTGDDLKEKKFVLYIPTYLKNNNNAITPSPKRKSKKRVTWNNNDEYINNIIDDNNRIDTIRTANKNRKKKQKTISYYYSPVSPKPSTPGVDWKYNHDDVSYTSDNWQEDDYFYLDPFISREVCCIDALH